MDFLNNIKIRKKLNYSLSLAMTVLILVMGIIILSIQERELNEEADIRMGEQTTDILQLIEREVVQNQEKVQLSMSFAESYFKNLGEISIDESNILSMRVLNQSTQQSKTIGLPSWTVNGDIIQESNAIVDAIQKQVGGTATIFQQFNDGYVRISTNVKAKDGKRATGTYIDNDSPVSKAITKGRTFTGRAFVVGEWYLTAYHPIKVDGQVKGILYVGVKEKELSELKSILSEKEFFHTGYPFIVDKNGQLIIHPEKEGENIEKSTLFTHLVSDENLQSRIESNWDDKDVLLYSKYMTSIEAYVCALVFKDDLLVSIRAMRSVLAIILVIGIIIFVLINSWISSNIAKGLEKVAGVSEAIAKGDLNQDVDIQQKDEIGRLAASLSSMKETLKGVVGTIQTGAGNVAQASEQLSAGSQNISSGVNEQAANAEEVSSSMEEMTANIQQNTENAVKTRDIALKASGDIELVAQASNESMQAVQDIVKRIGIVVEIAEKTDLLAINAAVEAARAGEEGRGFAVVAGEVRKLAERSQQAANDIVELAEQGLVLTQSSTEKLNAIVPEIKKTSQLVEEIAAGGREQEAGAHQVNAAIQQLSQITQRNASSSEEMASSSEELSVQAGELEDAISFFSINNRHVGVKNKVRHNVMTNGILQGTRVN
ncbi:Cache 3/Cache 2 fusion domain-containing protein [Carboxylicivirga sp. M1479]|uniref:methyl-accepting chemotaxis protein n=1 Tax=Carboxylicivirga sp. M1479 TaxID=2594476 RepID=UPI001177E25B|nr:Cache 3/Cache 2 fusion domain-containing protein [Carboxylicivirga sp. M1479]TRX72067.1 HAMP domain-containing protein [Carboxylicivirga sp. M1479]